MMQRWLRDLALCFAAGAAGGAAKSLLVWGCNYFAISAALGGYLASALHPPGLYARIVWGGLYGFLFLLPAARGSLLFGGLLWGAVASLLQLVILPLLAHGGLHLAPVLLLSTLVLNCFWGCISAVLLRWIN
jgi:hypothetical protein